MLEGLQTFTDKQLDETEEKFSFKFPEELRWVLKIIGVGGDSPLDKYHICNPLEPFNGLYFRRCDMLDLLSLDLSTVVSGIIMNIQKNPRTA